MLKKYPDVLDSLQLILWCPQFVNGVAKKTEPGLNFVQEGMLVLLEDKEDVDVETK